MYRHRLRLHGADAVLVVFQRRRPRPTRHLEDAMTRPDDTRDGEIAISIEGRGPTVVDALADVLLGAQDCLRVIDGEAE